MLPTLGGGGEDDAKKDDDGGGGDTYYDDTFLIIVTENVRFSLTFHLFQQLYLSFCLLLQTLLADDSFELVAV